MQRFTDARAHTWVLEINTWSVPEVEKATGVNIIDEFARGVEGIQRLADPRQLVPILYALCEDQLDEQLGEAGRAAGTHPREFARGLVGQFLEDAFHALVHAVIDFFPTSRQGPLRLAFDKLREADQRTIEAVTSALQSQEIADAIEQAGAQFEKQLVGTAASSDSIPEDVTS